LPFADYAIGIVIALGWNLVMLHMVVGKLTVAASRAGESMQCLREEYVTDAEERLHRLQSVGAKVAHELKNPLASIKGLCQLIARTPRANARRSDSRRGSEISRWRPSSPSTCRSRARSKISSPRNSTSTTSRKTSSTASPAAPTAPASRSPSTAR